MHTRLRIRAEGGLVGVMAEVEEEEGAEGMEEVVVGVGDVK